MQKSRSFTRDRLFQCHFSGYSKEWCQACQCPIRAWALVCYFILKTHESSKEKQKFSFMFSYSVSFYALLSLFWNLVAVLCEAGIIVSKTHSAPQGRISKASNPITGGLNWQFYSRNIKECPSCIQCRLLRLFNQRYHEEKWRQKKTIGHNGYFLSPRNKTN